MASLCPFTVYANSDDEFSGDNIWEDFKAVTKAPTELSTEETVKAVAWAGVTAGLMWRGDGAINDARLNHPDSWWYQGIHRLGWLGKWYGKRDANVPILWAGLSSVLLIAGMTNDDNKLTQTAGLLTESFAFTLIYTGAIQLFVGRDRPYADTGPHKFRFFDYHLQKQRHSFPSGHTSSAWSMMTVLAKQYSDWYVAIPAYTFALAVAAQRVDSGKHWMSDAVVGALVGYFVSQVLVERHKAYQEIGTAGGGTMAPIRIGFSVQF